MFHIVLVEPEIPSNTGNIARTCAATGMRLHLVKPLGFDISEKSVKRAGLDYWDKLDLRVYENYASFEKENRGGAFWFLSTKAPRAYTQARFKDGCYLLFGKETAGLPETLLHDHYGRCLRIPMLPAIRSLNLSNSVAVVAYEALRQTGFAGFQEAGRLTRGTPGAAER